MSERLPVHRIEMPTPYAVGPVNAYVIDAHPLTLIDAGINTPEARDALEARLDEIGASLEAIERVLVTHGHPDHYGLVREIQERSQATVHFPERELARVRDRQVLFDVGRLLMEAGMPVDLLVKMEEQRRGDPRPKMNHDTIVPVADGELFAFEGDEQAFELEAHFMPGHTGGHLVYFERDTRTLFAGDQLLPEVSPNPLLEPSLDEPGERRRSLEDYLASLQAMAEMNASLVYPGHGDPVTEPLALIRRTIDHHHARKNEIAQRLNGAAKTPYELAKELFPGARGYDAFLSVSEVVAHLDLVLEEGRAEVERRGGVTFYKAAGQ